MKFDIDRYLELAGQEISPQSFSRVFFKEQDLKSTQRTLKKEDLFHLNPDFNVSFHHEPLVHSIVEDCQKPAPEHAILHNHDFFEIVYVYSGNFSNVFEGKTIEQTKQTLLFLNPFALHTLLSQEYSDIAINIMLSPKIVEHTFLQLLGGNSVLFHFFLDSIYGTHKNTYLAFTVTSEISEIVQQIVSEFFERKPFFEQVLVAKLTDLFAHLARNYTNVSQIKEPECSNQITDILEHLRVHYASATLESVAESFHYSPKYLSSFIRQHTKRTFSQIIYDHKLQNACNYLANSTLPIEAINSIVGYSSTNNLFRIFKREFGISPSEYRRQHQPV